MKIVLFCLSSFNSLTMLSFVLNFQIGEWDYSNSQLVTKFAIKSCYNVHENHIEVLLQ